MNDRHSDVEQAERLGRRRALMLPILAAFLLAHQASFLVMKSGASAGLERTVDRVTFGAWIVLSLVLVGVLYTGGFWLRRRAVRALMDDDVSRAHRAGALSLGFLVAMLGAIGLYVLDAFEPMPARLAIHLIVTFGLAAALLRFGWLERRAHAVG